MKTLLLYVRTSFNMFYCSFFVHSNNKRTIYHQLMVPILLIGIILLSLEFTASKPIYDWTNLVTTFPLGFIGVPILVSLYSNNNISKNASTYIISLIPICLFGFSYSIVALNASSRYWYNLDYAVLVHFLSFLYLASFVLFLKTKANLMKENNKILYFGLYLTFTILICIELLQVHLLIKINSAVNFLNVSFLTHSAMFSLGIIAIYMNSTRKIALDVINLESDDIRPLEKPGLAQILPEQEKFYVNKINLFIQSLSYLKQDLNKEQFCTDFGIPEEYVLPLLKKEYGKGFNDFLNHLRLEYAVKLLDNQKQTLNIDELAFNCGFKSRATFYRNFKNTYNCTPHQYRANLLEVIKSK